MIDWSVAYDNRAAVPGAHRLPERWRAEAERFAADLGARRRVIATGPGSRQRTHLMVPEGAAAGLAVFVHGGYWQRNDPEMFLHLAAGALARGWAVAVPGYTLAPVTRIGAIAAEIAAALCRLAAEIDGPLRLAGHSAGGHLVCRMLCRGALPAPLLARLGGVLSISGIHDLRPLRATPMAGELGLDLAEARAESPALLEPAAAVPLTAWVGGAELAELRRQSRLIVEIWGGLGLETRLVEAEGEDHFSVIEGLIDPSSPISEAWTG